MLQQTQVSTVIPYYQRFMASFPSVQALAAAHEDEVLHHWTGLGYYARARNLHRCAQIVSDELGGEFPNSVEELEQLPGIGRSTAGAIHAISRQQRALILDGNVKRVLSRLHCVEGWYGQSAVAKRLWQLADELTPQERPADYTQAIMDLGATVCTRSRPNCQQCPLLEQCQAYARGEVSTYPQGRPRKEKPVKQTCMLLLQNPAGEIWLEKRPPSGIWGGLWSLPETASQADVNVICNALGLHAEGSQALPAYRHTFSHYHLDIQPLLVSVAQATTMVKEAGGQWYNPAAPSRLGLAAPVKRLLDLTGE